MKLNKRKRYELRLKDHIVAEFSADDDVFPSPSDSVGNIRLLVVHDRSRMPIPLRNIPEQHLGQALSGWLNRRKTSINRANARELYGLLNLDARYPNIHSLLDATLGLSMSDAYWMPRSGTDLSFSDVDPHRRNIDTLFFKTGLFGAQRTQEANRRQKEEKTKDRIRTTEMSSNGMLPKGWFRTHDGQTVLLKGGTVFSGLEPWSERIASRLLDCAGVLHVDYELMKLKDGCDIEKIYSVCEAFTNSDVSFVPFRDIPDRDEILYGTNISDFMTALSPDLGIAYRTMAVMDSIIENGDRHMENFGFLMDNETGKLMGFAPLFDHGCSLCWNLHDSELERGKGRVLQRPYGETLDFEEWANIHGDAIVAKTLENMLETIEKMGGMKNLLLSAVPAPYIVAPFSEKRIDFLSDFLLEKANRILETMPMTNRIERRNKFEKIENLVRYVSERLFDPEFLKCEYDREPKGFELECPFLVPER